MMSSKARASAPPGSHARRIADERSLVAAINEEVSLHPHDPAWAQVFELERNRLQSMLPGCFLAIEHIGSTAIPGLVAKPIVDIMAAVRSLEGVDALIERLCDNGYSTSLEFNASLTDRKWLMRWRDGHRTHHLHIVVLGNAQWVDRLAFRDALRGDPAQAQRYAELKTTLATRHRDDRGAYTDAKSLFVRDTVAGHQKR
ncbi:MAG: GrpB family protein [Burkholderiaceae bacterium]